MNTREVMLRRVFYNLAKQGYRLTTARKLIYRKHGYKLPFNDAKKLHNEARIIVATDMELI